MKKNTDISKKLNTHISSSELIGKNNFPSPHTTKDFGSYSFWHYTTLSTADKILESESIHVGLMANMNDLDETELHAVDAARVYSVCFCNSDTEKIPMWYLYAGISGKGATVGLTPSVMKLLIDSLDTVYAYKSENGTKAEIPLTKNKDFNVEYGWVFYRKKEQPSQVMYKGQWYELTDQEAFETNNYFIKSYPWEYEKEFRIVIHNKTDVCYDHLALKFSEKIYKKLKVKLAPEQKEITAEQLPKLKGFQKYLLTKLEKSALNINMNLCKRNLEGFWDYVKTVQPTSLTDEEKEVLENIQGELSQLIKPQ